MGHHAPDLGLSRASPAESRSMTSRLRSRPISRKVLKGDLGRYGSGGRGKTPTAEISISALARRRIGARCIAKARAHAADDRSISL